MPRSGGKWHGYSVSEDRPAWLSQTLLGRLGTDWALLLFSERAVLSHRCYSTISPLTASTASEAATTSATRSNGPEIRLNRAVPWLTSI